MRLMTLSPPFYILPPPNSDEWHLYSGILLLYFSLISSSIFSSGCLGSLPYCQSLAYSDGSVSFITSLPLHRSRLVVLVYFIVFVGNLLLVGFPASLLLLFLSHIGGRGLGLNQSSSVLFR